MKIISGIYRGRELLSPHDDSTHPMGSRERLALMNILGPDTFSDAIVLDAFAGTGALGLEALSRGAKKAVFIEKNHASAAAIRKNITAFGLTSDQAELHEQPVETFTTTETFTLIFADPPYKQISKKSLRPLAKLLKKDGLFVLSHPNGFDPLAIDNGECPMELVTTRHYAAANISILRKKC